jgi:hypothetical protein
MQICAYAKTKANLDRCWGERVAALMSAASGAEDIVKGSGDVRMFCLVAFWSLKGSVKKRIRPDE